jgi:hypothetical protein
MNDRDYPIPSYAVYVWLMGDKLHVCFPPTVAARGHTVTFPANERGASLFLSVMRERKPGLTIGQPGEPTGYQIERTLAGDKKYNKWLRAMDVKYNEWLRAMNVIDERQKEIEALLEEING